LAGYDVRQLTQSVALHCAQNKLGIRCNSVHPGIVSTPMFEAAFGAEERARRMGRDADRREAET